MHSFGALAVIALGAILRFGISDTFDGVNLNTIGLIIMVVGLVGLVVALFADVNRRRSATHRQVQRRADGGYDETIHSN